MTRLQTALAVVLVAALGGAERSSNAASGLRLEVVTADRHVIWSAPIQPGESFDLAFTHSAERCRWVHHYVASAPNSIEQRGSAFPCFGAGMPSSATDRSPVRRTPEGFETAAPLTLRQIGMMNWRAADITLRVGADTVALGRRLADYERFTLRIR